MQTVEIDGMTYWSDPFRAVVGRPQLVEFTVMDIEECDLDLNASVFSVKASRRARMKHATVEVARTSDLG
jgi:hypothetical protein